MSRSTPVDPPVAAPSGATTVGDPAGGPAVPPDGRTTRWADHRTARRTELVHAARRAVHRNGPDVSMDEIAAAAQTSKSIVYRYFADKSALQVAVGEAVVASIHDALDEAARAATTPRDGLRSMIGVYLAMVEASPNVYRFVTRPVDEDGATPLGPFLDGVATLVAQPFARVVAGGDPMLVDAWATGAVGFVRGAGEWWMTRRTDADAPTRDELTDRLTTWLWTGPVSSLARSRPETQEAR
ncbi:MAG TPA: TetR/AcrR family transcriptional regulator [Actinotalea sp.]|nr:TetR/AcrR family transcriptional regulator [Actinotalea sp.]